MCDSLVIPIHETYKIFLIKSPNIYALLVVEAIYKVGVLDYHHPFCGAFVNHVVCQTFLVFFSKVVLGICTELTIIRWIKEDEIIFCWLSCL